MLFEFIIIPNHFTSELHHLRAASDGGAFAFYYYGRSASLETRPMYLWFSVLKSYVFQ